MHYHCYCCLHVIIRWFSATIEKKGTSWWWSRCFVRELCKPGTPGECFYVEHFYFYIMRIKFKCLFISSFLVLSLSVSVVSLSLGFYTHFPYYRPPPPLTSLPTAPHHDNCNQHLLCVNILSLLYCLQTLPSVGMFWLCRLIFPQRIEGKKAGYS